MKHKFLTVLLAFVAAFCLCFGLAACGEKPSSQDPSVSAPSGSENTEEDKGGSKDPEGDQGGEGQTCAHEYTAENVCSLCGDKWKYTEGLNYTYMEETDTYAVGENSDISGDVVIPYGYPGKFVTEIGEDAFSDCKQMTSIVIPDSVTKIGNSAFSSWEVGMVNDKLKSVDLGKGLKVIGFQAFFGCAYLTELNIPNSVIEIGVGAFTMCRGLTSIVIPAAVTEIGEHTFRECFGLTSVIIPESMAKIGENAFYGCVKLIEVWNYSDLDIVAGNRGNGCIGLYAKYVYTKNEESKQKKTSDGYIFYENGNEVYLLGYAGNDTRLKLPDKSPSGKNYEIYQQAFYGRYELTNVEIPDSVTKIGNAAFVNCSGIECVKIGSGVTEIGRMAFVACSSLTDIQFAGTKEAWQKVTKGENWEMGVGDLAVTCTNGTVDKEGNVTYFEN